MCDGGLVREIPTKNSVEKVRFLFYDFQMFHPLSNALHGTLADF